MYSPRPVHLPVLFHLWRVRREVGVHDQSLDRSNQVDSAGEVSTRSKAETSSLF